ncbi:uncharacterized protein [Rutidosis leptorrhynchoides]|uniref:uncharacterized protein n=1 Tax=Rutidosis leptorrhynchoides TaxID=125765 RepID=UPI003A99933A
MRREKITTPRAVEFKLQQENGIGESFRVLYYGKASSVPFMWESQPGTPKHVLTESCLPPLTPPPSYNQSNQKYNSSRDISNYSRKPGSLRDFFLASSRKTSSFSSCSVSSSSSLSSHLNSSQSSPAMFRIEDDCSGDSPTSTLCFGGGFKKSYRIKKVRKTMFSFLS